MTRREVIPNATTGVNGPLTAQFDELVKRTLEEWKVPGLSIAIVEGDQTWAKVGHLSFSTVYAVGKSIRVVVV